PLRTVVPYKEAGGLGEGEAAQACSASRAWGLQCPATPTPQRQPAALDPHRATPSCVRQRAPTTNAWRPGATYSVQLRIFRSSALLGRRSSNAARVRSPLWVSTWPTTEAALMVAARSASSGQRPSASSAAKVALNASPAPAVPATVHSITGQ